MKKITLLFTAIAFTFYANAQLLYTFDSVKINSGTTGSGADTLYTGMTGTINTAEYKASN
ncbi:MAG TPA: hypothetical protein VJI69_06345 [Bacteroidia bacterium]|nr:hypothetical protein [Bacteroidia bacterium]